MKNEEKFTTWFGKIRINDYDDYIQLEKMLISLCGNVIIPKSKNVVQRVFSRKNNL